MAKISNIIKISSAILIALVGGAGVLQAMAQSSTAAAAASNSGNEIPSVTREEIIQKYTVPITPIAPPKAAQPQTGEAASPANDNTQVAAPNQPASPPEMQVLVPAPPAAKKPRTLWEKLKNPPVQRMQIVPGNEQQAGQQPASSTQPQRYNIYQ